MNTGLTTSSLPVSDQGYPQSMFESILWARDNDWESGKVYYTNFDTGERTEVPHVSVDDDDLWPYLSTEELIDLVVRARAAGDPYNGYVSSQERGNKLDEWTISPPCPPEGTAVTGEGTWEGSNVDGYHRQEDGSAFLRANGVLDPNCYDPVASDSLSEPDKAVFEDRVACSNDQRALLQGQGFSNGTLLDSPNGACSNQKCKRQHNPWPTSGELVVPACMSCCEVCAKVLKSGATNLRRHVEAYHVGTHYVPTNDSKHRVLWTSVRAENPAKNKGQKRKTPETAVSKGG